MALNGKKSSKVARVLTQPRIEHRAYRNKNLTGLCMSSGKEREGV